MKLGRILRATTAVTAVGLAFPLGAVAAEVKPGGALDLTITGFLRAEAGGGQQNDLQLDNSLGARPRLPQRHRGPRPGPRQERGDRAGVRCHDRVRGRHQQTFNTDETWVFLRGGWGELRMGDEDGVVDNSIIGGQTIAAGTGGIDGSSFVVGEDRRRGRVPDRDRRRDQDPLLHAELRRVQPRRQLHADPVRRSAAAPTTASSSPARAAPTPWKARTSSRVASSTTAISAGSASRPRSSASTAS